jgi:hypothetical protein
MKIIFLQLVSLMLLFSCGSKVENEQNNTKSNIKKQTTKIIRNPNRPKDAEKVFLRFRPEIGTTKTMKMEVNIEFMGQEMTSFISMDQKFTKKYKNGDFDSETQYTDVSVQASGLTMTMDDNPELRVLGESKVFATYNELGEIVKIICDNPKLKQQFEEAQNNALTIYPKEEIYLGDSWKIDKEMNINGLSMKLQSTYTLKEIGQNTYTINVDAIGTGSPMKMDMSGRLILDKETGYFISGQINQTFDMPQGSGRNSIKIDVN